MIWLSWNLMIQPHLVSRINEQICIKVNQRSYRDILFFFLHFFYTSLLGLVILEYRQLRTRRVLTLFNDVPLRTRGVLTLFNDVLLRTRRVLTLFNEVPLRTRGPFHRTCHQWQFVIHWQIKWHSWFWLAMKHCCHGSSQWMTSCHWWQVLWNGPQKCTFAIDFVQR